MELRIRLSFVKTSEFRGGGFEPPKLPRYATTLRKVDQKYQKSFEMWCWQRMGKISWTDRVRNEEVLHRVKKEINTLPVIN
jgi:hypothetical protein